MPTIYITSGTSWTAPSDFTSNNKIECYGGGAPGQAGTGGGGGSYAKILNITGITPGSSHTIHIGSAGNRDTYFNATSLANAVSNGTSVSCGAQGASGATGGASGSSCGTTKFSGGNGSGGGGSVGSGGGGGCAGPNGAGGNGGGGGAVNYGGGGGGGGANGGTNGGTGGTNVGGTGGNGGRTGTGGGASNASGTAGTGGGAGGAAPNVFDGHKGAYDDVYGDGVHGPGGGGGGSTWDSGGSILGFAGNGGGFGGGCGGYQSSAAQNVPADGLIVITYTIAPPVAGMGNEGSPLTLQAKPSFRIPVNMLQRDVLTPPANLSWYQQPTALLHPPQAWTFQVPGQVGPPAPNPTPLFRNAHPQAPDLFRHPPTLDTRQQFPGKAPSDFHIAASEGADVLSNLTSLIDPVNANIPETDTVLGFVIPTPLKGSADDIVQRVKVLLPKRWWSFVAPIRDAILGGIADLSSWSYSLIIYAKLQSRVAWATDIWLDIISRDYFGNTLPRKTNESDAVFRLRIQKELIRERVTRKGMITAIEDLTGLPAVIFEPWNTGDTGAWDNGTFALDIAGGWGDYLPAQSFLNVTPPGLQGIVGIGGWDTGYLAWDGGIGMWADMSLIVGSVTTQDIYDTINKTRPTGSIVWTQLFPPALPIPIPPAPTLTPITALPLPSLPVVKPNPAAYSIPVIPDSLGLL